VASSLAALSAPRDGGILRDLFGQLTERARQVGVLAQEEARTLKHNYIGTEHILLGLLREEEGLAARVLRSFEITVERVRAQVVRIVGSGEEATSGQIQFTPRANKVLELALREALSLEHNYIGTEHILLGVVSENEGVAARILLDLNAGAETIRNEMLRILSVPGAQKYAEAKPPLSGRGNRYSLDQKWFDGLGGVLDGLAREIRGEVEREPDTGDLLLALACAPDTLAAQALHELGVNPEALPGVIKRVRAQQPPSTEAQLAQRIEEVRQAKELAIESQDFQTAAAMHDQERELIQQARADAVPPEVLQQIRRHLGISGPE
jgi:ATP-dependent Clp protease ATP-binding subunit ClpA